MKLKTFVIAYGLVVALFLFAQRHTTPAQAAFTSIVDLTHAINSNVPTYEPGEASSYRVKTVATIEKGGYFAREICLPEHFGTHIDAPAHFARGLWTVDQIPAERLVAPLVILDVSVKVKQNPDYQISVRDISEWETANGQIPQAAVVMAHTGWDSRWNSANPLRQIRQLAPAVGEKISRWYKCRGSNAALS